MVVTLSAGSDRLSVEPETACVPTATGLIGFWPDSDAAARR